MKVVALLALLLFLPGCASLLPWAGVIAAGISLTSNVTSDATQIYLHATPAAQPDTKPGP